MNGTVLWWNRVFCIYEGGSAFSRCTSTAGRRPYNLLFTFIAIVLQLNTFIPPNTFPTSLIQDFTSVSIPPSLSTYPAYILQRGCQDEAYIHSYAFPHIFASTPLSVKGLILTVSNCARVSLIIISDIYVKAR